MKVTIERDTGKVVIEDTSLRIDHLHDVITEALRAFPEEQRDSAVDALVERAEPYERPDRQDDTPIGFRPHRERA